MGGIENCGLGFKAEENGKSITVKPNLEDYVKVRILYYACIHNSFYPDYDMVGKKLNIKI